MIGVGWSSKSGGGTGSVGDVQDGDYRGGALLQGHSASVVAAKKASAVATATMITRSDDAGGIDNNKGGDQASTLAKKKSVRWGGITAHYHDRATTTETLSSTWHQRLSKTWGTASRPTPTHSGSFFG